MNRIEIITGGVGSIIFVALICCFTLFIMWACKKEKVRSFARHGVLFSWLFSITAIVTGVSGYVLSDSFYKGEYNKMELKVDELGRENKGLEGANKLLKKKLEERGIVIKEYKEDIHFSGIFYEGSQFKLNDVEFAIIPEQYTVNETKTILGKKGGKLKLTISKVNTPSFKRDSMSIVATYTPPKETVSHTPNKSQSRSGENWYSESDTTLAR